MRILFFSISLFVCTTFVFVTAVAAQDFKVMAFYTADGVEQRNFLPADIPVTQLTHLFYAFAIPKDLNKDGKYEAAMNSDEVAYNQIMSRHVAGTKRRENEMRGVLRQLRVLKRQNPQLKIMLSVGGACYYDAELDQCLALSPLFRTISQSEEGTAYFLDALVKLMIQPFPEGENQELFDGLDIDWEFPVAEDRAYYVPFIRALRQRLDAAGEQNHKRYLLTVDGAATQYFIQHVDIQNLAPLVDWVNVLSYLFHMPQSWNDHTGHNAPFASMGNDSHGQGYDVQNASIGVWQKGGMPMEKLALGLPFFGIGYKQVQSGNANYPGLNAKYDGALVEGGEIPYVEIWTDHYKKGGFKAYWDDQAQVPFMYNADTKAWISYDDTKSLSIKSIWAKEQKLAGIFLWELSQESMPNQPLAPLTQAITNALRTGRVPNTSTSSGALVLPTSVNDDTHIVFQIQKPGQTQVRLYDAIGNEVRKLMDEYLIPGTYSTIFQAKDMASGAYLCKISNGNTTETLKLTLLP
jgi:chitinase